MSNLIDHARRELEAAGFFSKDSDYNGMLGPAVMKLVEVHAAEGHSGFSHGYVLRLFNEVVNFKHLTPLTDSPHEWNDVGEQNGAPLSQSRRNSEAFSEDGGKTYYLLSEVMMHVACEKCGAGWTGRPRALEADDKTCHCGGPMKIVNAGGDKRDPAFLHASAPSKK